MGILMLLLAVGSSRVVINEVMANPAGGAGALQPEDRNEFVELYNPGLVAVDLWNWTIDDGDSRDMLGPWHDPSVLDANPSLLIGSTWLRPGGYAVVLDPEYTAPNPEGGHVRPYPFGDSTLLLTVGNTTIGNGLAVNDPLILASPYGDTSTFGTPFTPEDSIPCNPGDGISWERIRQERPDTVDNWITCLDPFGSTPGAANSILTFTDLSVETLLLTDPARLKPDSSMPVLLRIANAGFTVVSDWALSVFLDRNGNGHPEPSEISRSLVGWPFAPGTDSALDMALTCPQTRTDLWAIVVCPEDWDSTNDSRRVTIDPGGGKRLLSLATSSFSPDGDGFEDELKVVYRLPEYGGRLRIVVFDLGGRAIRTLFDARPGSDQGVVGWDGRDDAGNRLSAAVYAVWLEHRTKASTQTEKLPVVLYR
ncbi:MAG: lamin tail domain-containing protein [candidate division WOR-3 bacterium]|nr:MAG: lamin tail domain-containing protein [candidate division WOR-3 bacterium]